METRFLEWSPWAPAPTDIQPPLQGEVTADVVIIGGGFTGLNAAIELRDAGVDVAVLELDFCGKGASGRNAGHLTPTIGKDFPTMVKSFGEDRALAYAKFAERSVIHTESVFDRLGIACDYKPAGNIVTGVHKQHRDALMRAADVSSRLGIGVEFLDGDEMRRRQLPPFGLFGVLEHHGGHLNPGKYIAGLRRAALEKGVRIFEGTQVLSYDDRSPTVEVIAEKGKIRADKLIVATNAYTPATLKRLKTRILPMRCTLWRTAVLTDEQRAVLGWPGEEGLYTSHESLENYRLTADGRLSGGSKFVQYGYGSTLPEGEVPDVFRSWDALFKSRFSYIPGLKIEQFWGGWIGMTLDFLPFNFTKRNGRTTYTVGMNGHGVAQGTMFGKLAADRVLGRTNPDNSLFDRFVFPLPPEPVRWIVVRQIGKAIQKADKITDRDIALGNAA